MTERPWRSRTRIARRSWGARLVVLIALSVARRLFPGAVPDRAQDQPVADGDRAAALHAGARSRRRLGGLRGLRRRAVVRQLRARSPRTRSISRPICAACEIAAVSTADPAADRLSASPTRMARAPRRLQAGAGDAGDAAVLDLVPDPRLCLDQHPAARRSAQRGAARARHRRRAAGVARDRHRGLYRHRLFLSAVHGAAALRHAARRWTTALLEAAADLGCPRWKAFWLVTLPLSLPGVVAGALLCFIPIVGEFVIPDLLGGSRAR